MAEIKNGEKGRGRTHRWSGRIRWESQVGRQVQRGKSINTFFFTNLHVMLFCLSIRAIKN